MDRVWVERGGESRFSGQIRVAGMKTERGGVGMSEFSQTLVFVRLGEGSKRTQAAVMPVNLRSCFFVSVNRWLPMHDAVRSSGREWAPIKQFSQRDLPVS